MRLVRDAAHRDAAHRDAADRAYVCLAHLVDGSLDVEPGACRTCARPFTSVPTERAFACPKHVEIVLSEAGPCPLCQRAMREQRMAVVRGCPEHGVGARPVGETSLGERCELCRAELEPQHFPLPHGDHSPKHGGVFFMARDRWHHLEGTLPEAGRFRLYLYDNFTRPLDPATVRGHVRVGRIDSDGGITLGDEKLALVAAPGTGVLEVTAAALAPPCELAVFVSLGGGTPRERATPAEDGAAAERFDFSFDELTVDRATAPTRRARPLEVPGSAEEIAAAVAVRVARVGETLAAGKLAELYVAALEAKDLALALEEFADDLPRGDRGALERALRSVVRGAWRVDWYGDLGDLSGAREAFGELRAGTLEIGRLFGAPGEG